VVQKSYQLMSTLATGSLTRWTYYYHLPLPTRDWW